MFYVERQTDRDPSNDKERPDILRNSNASDSPMDDVSQSAKEVHRIEDNDTEVNITVFPQSLLKQHSYI
jgi:hypothetical protein